MNDVDKIIDEIKNGATYTIACSRYEEYYWYKDGKFYTAMENGMNEPVSRKRDEAYIRKGIQSALMCPESFDVYQEY